MGVKNGSIFSMIRGLALDIDDTLSDTQTYWYETLSTLFGNPENLTPREITRKYGRAEYVPFWQTPEALDWMEHARVSNDLHGQLPLIDNAHHIVQKINRIIPIVAYITARLESVHEATTRWLRKHDFPEVELITRPLSARGVDGNLWKSRVLHEMHPQIIGIVDDNPSLVDYLSVDYKGVVFLYDNVEHVRSDIHVVPCLTWDDVHTAVLDYKARVL